MGFHRPEQTIATLAVAGLVVFLLVRFLRWVFSGPTTPDPWDATVAAGMDDPEAARVCHRCLTEHPGTAHFCPHCGSAVGDYNNVLPWDQVFSEGEVFRNGATLPVRPSFLVIGGYFLASLAAYHVFAPFYWFVLLRKLAERRTETAPSLPDA